MKKTIDAPATLLEHLRARWPGMSATSIKKRLKLGTITVNDVAVTRPDHALVEGDVVSEQKPERPRPHQGGLTILHDDDDLVVVEKPAGLLSFPKDDGDASKTALTVARALLEQSGRRVPRLYAIHRLDRETSGVLALAKSVDAREAVMARWAEVEKQYVAIVDGHPSPPAARVALKLRELPSLKVVVDAHASDARDAITRYQVRDRGPDRARVDVWLETGRKHQIRVTFAHLGFPVTGDAVYGTAVPGFARHALHAARLSLFHPTTGAPLTFTSDEPAAFARLLATRLVARGGRAPDARARAPRRR